MKGQEQSALEISVRAFCEAEQYQEAASEALRVMGPELLGFLSALTRDAGATEEVFSQFSEDLWKGLPKFGWKSSFRTWAYTLARNAWCRYLRDPYKRRGQHLATGELAQLAQARRTATLTFMKTAIKDRFARLRATLDADDQALLILRIDRGMSWKDIARVMSEEGSEPGQLRTRAASLRKRFERVKNRLREMALEEGLFQEE